MRGQHFPYFKVGKRHVREVFTVFYVPFGFYSVPFSGVSRIFGLKRGNMAEKNAVAHLCLVCQASECIREIVHVHVNVVFRAHGRQYGLDFFRYDHSSCRYEQFRSQFAQCILSGRDNSLVYLFYEAFAMQVRCRFAQYCGSALTGNTHQKAFEAFVGLMNAYKYHPFFCIVPYAAYLVLCPLGESIFHR